MVYNLSILRYFSKSCSKTDIRNACTTCDPAKLRELNGNVCVCMDGYYENLNFECVKPFYCPSGYGKQLFNSI